MALRFETVQKFKSQFEVERDRIVAQRTFEQVSNAMRTEAHADDFDAVAVGRDREMQLRMMNREALYLKKINEALKRLEAGSFGICVLCEENIEEKRLEARPTTVHCLACKEEEERNERTHMEGIKHFSINKNTRLKAS